MRSGSTAHAQGAHVSLPASLFGDHVKEPNNGITVAFLFIGSLGF